MAMSPISPEALADLHAMTMDIYRCRINKVAEVAGADLPPTVVDSLARMIDLCAAERVLDEADYTEMPGWDHPATRELRKRLNQAEETIAALVTVPTRLRAALTADGEVGLWQLAMVDQMDAATLEAADGIALTAVSDMIATTRMRTIDSIIEDLHEKAFVTAIEQPDGAGLAASQALVEVADSLLTERNAAFAAVDHHRVEINPEVHSMI